ncbi:MAG: glycoside hydrolase family 32 protein [Chloroflexota bacterium]|nr:MAG: glycoside hydrolase family 32 protein [Chloroflexota bacterium]
MPYDETYRPHFHFSPAAHWLNDPNGLVFYEGEYHLFYQHYPAGTTHGPMHWGHAVAADLVNWTHMPIALYPDRNGYIYSGSAVIDWHDTAGFGKEAMVAIFTHHLDGRQSQSIAYSTDKGRSWTKYHGNPVIKSLAEPKDFRDPKVFWFEKSEGDGHWIMLLAAGNHVLFYSSPDLKDWSLLSRFGPDRGCTEGVWETPELFELPVAGGPDTRWILAVAVSKGAPAGGSGVQYFVGDFDGSTFTSENPRSTILWADYGPDFYASQAWTDEPFGRVIWTAWMNNWRYAEFIPTSTWRGSLAFPRRLGLRITDLGLRLLQEPVSQIESLRGKRWFWQDEFISPENGALLDDVQGQALDILAEFEVLKDQQPDSFGLQVRVGKNEQTTVGYNSNSQVLFVDRSASGQADFCPGFAGKHSAQMEPNGDTVQLRILVDSSSVEVFGNNGQVVLTERIFPDDRSAGLRIYAIGGPVWLRSLYIYVLDKAIFADSSEPKDAAVVRQR